LLIILQSVGLLTNRKGNTTEGTQFQLQKMLIIAKCKSHTYG